MSSDPKPADAKAPETAPAAKAADAKPADAKAADAKPAKAASPPGPIKPDPKTLPPPTKPEDYKPPAWFKGDRPYDSPHVCALTGKRIRKNHESWHGPLTREMIAAIKKDHPHFHPKMDLCKEIGEKYWKQVEATQEKRPWLARRLG